MSDIAPPLPTPGRTGTHPVFIMAGIAVIEMLIFGISVASGATGWDMMIVMLALVTAFVGAVPIVLDQTRPLEHRQLLIPLTVLVYSIFLVLPVFTNYLMLKGELVRGTFHLTKNAPQDIAHAQVVALIGLVMLLVGFYLPFGRVAVAPIPKARREWSSNSALILGIITLGMGWTVYLGSQYGLVPRVAGSGALGTISNGWFFGVSLVTLVWLRHRSPQALLLLMIVVPMSMGFNFFTGSKRLFLTPPFMVALAFMVWERRVRRNWVFAGLALLVFLYPVSQFYRDAIQTDKVRSARAFLSDPAGAIQQVSGFMGQVELSSYLRDGLSATGARLDGLAVLTVIVRDTPRRVPYQNGRTLALVPISYIPRFLWPGKPTTTIGEWVSQSYGSPYDLHTDVGPSWMGEFFFNFGYAGVVVGMFLLGVFCRMLQERMFYWGAPIPALLCACIVLYAVPRAVQGALIAPINGTVFNIVPVIIAHFLVGIFGGYHREPQPATPLGQPLTPGRPAAPAPAVHPVRPA